MTHTLHRRGSVEQLEHHDYVILSMSAKTVNAKGSGPKMAKMFEILNQFPSVNFGDCKTGSKFQYDYDYIHDHFVDTSVLTFCFDDPAVVKDAIKALKEADLGVSVIVSGVADAVRGMIDQAGLKLHTIEFSGGIHGKLDLLPDEPVLEITTMCGHAQVSPDLVQEMVRQVRKGKKTLKEAAEQLAQPCACGIFNPTRAEYVLSKLVEGA